MSKHLAWLVAFEFGAIVPLILVVYWVQKFLSGFVWEKGNNAKFNYHPFFMLIGFVFIMGHAVITFRILPLSHRVKKYIHASLNLVALVFIIIGLVAVFENHNEQGIEPLWSVHSWIGIVTFAIFVIQALSGLSVFQDLVEGASNEVRGQYKPYHVAAGTLIVSLVTVTILTGITEKYLFIGSMKSFSPHAMVLNFLGLVVVFWAATVIFILHSGVEKRSPENDYNELPNERSSLRSK